MAIPNISGELGDAPLDVQENDKIIGVEKIPGDMTEILPKQPHIYTVNNNLTALNAERDERILDNLKSFVAGTPIKVEWFHILSSTAEDNSNFTNISFLSSTVNSSYLHIINMEIKLKEAMSFEYNNTDSISGYTGSAVLFPGFIPNIGDLFIYIIDNGAYGLFKVDEEPERLSINTQTSHAVRFSLIKILSTNEREELIARVRRTAYFNKKRFLSDDTALLTHQEVLDLEYVENTMSNLIKHYSTKFYFNTINSIIRPDYKYDPYIVKFIQSTMGRYLDKKYIVQVADSMINPESWYRSIYNKLLTRDNISDMINTCRTEIVRFSGFQGMITSLINRDVVLIDKDGEDTYFENNVMSLNTEGYTSFDKVVTLLLCYGIVQYPLLKELADNIRKEEDMVQFYQIPVIIYILKLLKSGILTGKQLQYITQEVPAYINIRFTSSAVEEYSFTNELDLVWDEDVIWDMVGPLTIETNGGKILSILTDENEVLYPTASDITYTDTIADIDIQTIMTENGISDIEGIWKVVLTNPLFS